MSFSTDRARADRESGRLWKARDRLHGLLVERQDVEVLDLLAEVHHAMHDLPAAGAIWFVTGRDDQLARDSIAAWRERHGNDEARWHSIPSPIRSAAHSHRLDALARAAKQDAARRAPRWDNTGTYVASRGERLVAFAFGAVILVLLAMIGIGIWTTVHWTW